MVREYIGARYVPKFMGTYDNTQVYEALCVVDNGLGTSYITKVPTPPGTPLTDTDYWAIYGASSGAIINLQNQIDNIENTEIPALNSQVQTLKDERGSRPLKNRKFILIGDSYGRGYDGDTGQYTYRGWTYINKELLEAGGATVYLLAVGSGGGFTTSPNWQNGLADLVTSEGWSAEDCAQITDIVILGGTNDGAHNAATYASIKAAMASFFTYAKTTFPNAYFKLGVVSAVLTTVCNNSAKTWKAYSECIEYGVEFVTDGALLLNNMTYMGADETHLTLAGYEALCPKLYDLIVSGHCEYAYFYTYNINSLLGSDISKVFASQDAILKVSYNQNEVKFDIGNTDNSGTPFKIASVDVALHNYTFASGLPRGIPFTRKYMTISTGVGFAGTSPDNMNYNTNICIYVNNVAGDGINSSDLIVQVGRPMFVRSGMDLVFNTEPTPLYSFERY